ncbi:alpha/beta hydrolase [Kitasatospora sp. NPDC058170]|uniref:alpha/beta hydrolase n=1 Tax=Kitasatospora sp. NPDC058170 TaxID=3346364 RepID=UPI0036D897E9
MTTALAIAGTLTGGQVSAAASDTAGARPDGPARYHGQSIVWHDCRTGPDDVLGAALAGAGAQCGDITVPLDYRRPNGPTIKVAMSLVKATDPAHRRGVLFINPGGPGGPGMEQVLLGEYMPEVAARYDLVGMDPRFIGRSTPLQCRWSTDTFLRSAGPDRSSFAESVGFARGLAAGCTQEDRDKLPYASTRNTARDMDVVRAALGEDRISYYGVSYGTYLGAAYLQMYGRRADRFVLDSAVDPGLAGPGIFPHQGPALAAALANWAAFAARHSARYGLGATTAEVLVTVDRINEAATRRGLQIGRYRIDAHELPLVLAARLADDSEGAYADLSADVRVLADASRGSEVVPTAFLEQFLTGLFTGAGPATDRAGTPILCADRAVSPDPETYFRDIEAHRADEPLFGPLTRNVTPCAFWPIKPAEPALDIRNHARVLMVGATGDPLTPFAGQQAMHRALSGSRMVTLRGAFRHGVYLTAANTCIDTAVSGYLVGGVLPEGDAACDATPGKGS